MTAIWGIVNVTPDSFSDGGRHVQTDRAIAHGLQLIADGAAVIDVGGESTRPGADRVPVDVEQARVLPVIDALVAAGAVVSVDTMNADTAVAAVAAGAAYVNDVSGGLADDAMLSVAAGLPARFVIGHWRGPSADMYARADYRDVPREVAIEMQDRVAQAMAAGIAPDRIVIDPGVGFAKTESQNWELLRGLDEVVALGHPVLVGTSRKRFLDGAVGQDADERRRDLATAVTSALAARAGVAAVRVHDVSATRDALAVYTRWTGEPGG